MSKTTQQTDDLTRRIEDIEREAARLKVLLQGNGETLPAIIRARATIFIEDTAAGLEQHRRTVEDATKR